ncbi:hypothetical protein [Rheinheimera sp. MMS21-TC3]|uniref:hypothetical protein n=1 Tax=Rheinheimera sp. MMS21-TC3 TaxID=3072790 RepID=UPI0028C3F10F|nr:hypothetical protein [Rheinheimera sp. MMS21-TC3]WNO60212.1 hypothetical protein RDV63_04415 [Rheinheimera sp. MMS21-TC3]
MTTPHSWSFSRIGGFDQVLLTSAADLLNLDQLDPKLWTALACPTTGLHFDKKTLQLIDKDNDGRVRVPEVLDAVRWASTILKNPELLLEPASFLPLAEFNTKTTEGAALHYAAQCLLALLNKPEADHVSLEDVTNQQQALASARFNGDGIITPETIDAADRDVIDKVMSGVTAVIDASGKAGINQAGVSAFYDAIAARKNWLASAETAWLPDGVDGAAVAGSLAAVRTKIDDYFSRCRASQYDLRAAEQLNRSVDDWQAINSSILSADCAEIADFPLAMISPEAELPLTKDLNPAWESRINTLYTAVIKPVCGETDTLTYPVWQQLKARFDDYHGWLTAEAGKNVAHLSPEQLDSILTDGSRDKLEALIAEDLALKPQVDSLVQVETILRYRMYLKTLLNNFVNLTDFYSPDIRSIFEAGTLYLDGRACELCIEVHDMAKHATLAGLSKCFLAYCLCTRKDGAKKTIVAAFTGGSQDYLLVGRNGVFYDRDGLDWDVTITKLVENPISIPQAFFSPYKRLVRFLEEQAAKSAAAAEASSQSSLENKTSETLANRETEASKVTSKPKFDISIIAAMGVAVGGIATAMGMLLQAFFGLGWLMPVGMFALVLLVSGPSMFIAWLKLRQRNLGPILDASGWAINGQVKINVPFGSKLTQIAKLPTGSRRSLKDPYQQRSIWPKVITISLLVVAIAAGYLYWKNKSDDSSQPIIIESATVIEVPEQK